MMELGTEREGLSLNLLTLLTSYHLCGGPIEPDL